MFFPKQKESDHLKSTRNNEIIEEGQNINKTCICQIILFRNFYDPEKKKENNYQTVRYLHPQPQELDQRAAKQVNNIN